MVKWVQILALILAFSGSLPALANIDHEAEVELPSLFGTGMQVIGPFGSGVYTVTENTDLLPRAFGQIGGELENSDMTVITLLKRQPFFMEIEHGSVTLTPVVPESKLGQVPNSFVFELDDLRGVHLVYLMEAEREDFLADFSNMISYDVAGRCKALTEAHLGFHVAGLCSTDVSNASLAKVGFKPVGCDSPKAILKLWNGGHPVKGHPRKCGHMAYRKGRGWSSGDFHGDPGRKYSARGCWARSR